MKIDPLFLLVILRRGTMVWLALLLVSLVRPSSDDESMRLGEKALIVVSTALIAVWSILLLAYPA